MLYEACACTCIYYDATVGCRANLYLEVQSKSDSVLTDLKPLMVATKTGQRYYIHVYIECMMAVCV